MSQLSRPGWNAFVYMSDKGRKNMVVPHSRNLPAVMLNMGAKSLAADRLFSALVISNG